MVVKENSDISMWFLLFMTLQWYGEVLWAWRLEPEPALLSGAGGGREWSGQEGGGKVGLAPAHLVFFLIYLSPFPNSPSLHSFLLTMCSPQVQPNVASLPPPPTPGHSGGPQGGGEGADQESCQL